MKLYISYKFNKKYFIPIFIMVLGTLISVQNLAFYLRFDFNFLLVLLVAPFVIHIKKPGEYSFRFGFLSLLFLLLYPWLKIQSFYYMGFMFFLLFVAEALLGKLNNLPVFLILFFSPFTIFLFETFGFHIRLKLTALAAQILTFTGSPVSVRGNILVLNNDVFRIDPECMGLRMVSTAILILLFLISYYNRKFKMSLPLIWISLLLVLTFLLIALSNLTRIVAIVLFKSMPETFSHEMIGVICLFLYTIIPIFLFVRFTVRKFGIPMSQEGKPSKINYKVALIFSTILLSGLFILNLKRESFRNINNDLSLKDIELAGFAKSFATDGVVKFENDSALIYIKPSCNFYGAYHSPLICWKGSGSTFTGEQVIKINGTDISLAEMSYKNGTLYTAWWFDNGGHKTIGQLNWRWKMLCGENDYRLINVTCQSKEILILMSTELLKKNLFR